MIATGEKIPEFEVKNQNGDIVTHETYLGKNVIYFFYPKDNTPGCTLEANAFSGLTKEFEALNTVVVGISKDSVASHEKFCNKFNLSVALLSDPEMQLIEPFGIWQEKKNYGKTYMGIVRSTFAVDKNGKVITVWKNVKAKGHAEKVLEFMKEVHE